MLIAWHLLARHCWHDIAGAKLLTLLAPVGPRLIRSFLAL
tara:strand:- start:4326 stop:4445 length:120 start_codon:yes stop_codon:yes gene_type:complete